MMLPMLLMPIGMVMMFLSGGSGGGLPIGGGFMALGMFGMMGMQMMRQNGGDPKEELNSERDDYMRNLASQRKRLREAVGQQQESLLWNNPEPSRLIFTARGRRLWERQPTDDDFGEIRVGIGAQPNGITLSAPETVDIKELEPVSSRALRRLFEAYATVDGLPLAVSLLGFARLQIDGHPDVRRALARAILAQCVSAHSPAHVRVVVCASPDREADWDWTKWLPHSQDPDLVDAAGPRRLFAGCIADLEQEVLKDLVADRPRFVAHVTPSVEEPQLLVIVDGETVPMSSRLAGSGYRSVLTIDVDGALPWRPDKLSLRLKALPGDLSMIVNDAAGDEMEEVLGTPDQLSITQVRALAKTLARWRVGHGSDSSAPISGQVDLCEMLGIADARTYDPQEYWRVNGGSARLRVPIGLDERGTPVELDIRESAQGGMGPHGMLVGATGSGKSELLRTLVTAMAVRHSSEFLNFVLVDFKGGATFVGLDRLPHTSALITNLSDELPLVDRMQDAIHGELVRRQELLRAANYASLHDYERARAGGARLDPLPSLFLVIDEFSELLAVRRDFINLFLMVGRLGRSLGVHLLLATQRVDEGRVHTLEGHLSYRIGLRTFSASESRSVLGVTDAYDTPLTPGMGFIKTTTSSLQKFKGAYVSGELKRVVPDLPPSEVAPRHDVIAFGQHEAPLPEGSLVQLPESVDEPDGEDADDAPQDEAPVAREETMLHVVIDRLIDSGPPAHRVWLPPLDSSQSLDSLLGEVVADPHRGLTAVGWRGRLAVPVGYIDRPFEQRWDTLLADVSGASGNIGIVGGSQSGKSTMLRTLILSLALVNSPREVRFYCLDFSSGALSSLAGLPHVGSIGTRRDPDLVGRTLSEMMSVLETRERLFSTLQIGSMAEARQRRDRGEVPEEDDLADIFLVVDGWFTIKQDFDSLDQDFQQICARGLSLGLHVIVTSNRWAEMRTWLRDALGTKFELRLGDPSDSAIGMRAATNVPTIPGRGLTEDSMHFLAVLPRIDGETSVETLPAGTQAAVSAIAEAWPHAGAPTIRTIPALIRQEDLPAPEGGGTSKGDLRVALGIDEITVEPHWWDFGQTPHLVAFGDSETGKTALLRLVLRSIVERYSPDEAKIVLADYRRELFESVPKDQLLGYATSTESLTTLVKSAAESLQARMPDDQVPLEQLRRRDWWDGPRIFVVVDDLDLLVGSGFGVTSPLEPLSPLMPQGAHIGLHVIATRATAAGSRGTSEPAIRRAWELGNPALLLSCPREEGVIFGSTKPQTLPPGRAQLVTRRGAHLLQIGFAADRPRTEQPS